MKASNELPFMRLVNRAVEALETIAKNQTKPRGVELNQTTTLSQQNLVSQADIYRQTKDLLAESSVLDSIPAFFMPKNVSEIDFDIDAANGIAFIDQSGITIKLSPEYYPGFVREILGRSDISPVAITIALNYDEKKN